MIEISDVYKESCTSFRHYSKASLTLRVSVIAQGVVLLSTSGYLYKSQEYIYSGFAALFGALFTFSLLILHANYQRKAAIFSTSAGLLEKRFEEITIKVMSQYEEDHIKHVETVIGEITVSKGLFILILITFIVLATLAFINSAGLVSKVLMLCD
jgi:hypothetical protein